MSNRFFDRRRNVLAASALGLFMFWAPAFSAEEKSSQAGWAKTLEGAGKEGQVSVYYWGPAPAIDAGVFQKKFPQIKVVVTTGSGGQLLQRILSERRADKYLADVYIDGASNFHPQIFNAKAVDPIKSALLLPEVVDESKWWRGKHKYLDKEQQYVLAFAATPNFGTISYNTRLVDINEIKSYYDLLNPKWKGKIAARDISDAGGGSSPMRFFYYNPELGPSFIHRLFGATDVTLFRDTRQAVDWLASGKIAICFFCTGTEVAKRQGLPVEELTKLLKEGAGLSGQVGYVGLLNKAPHPNAAKVFINWFLSREGQITFQEGQAKDGNPRDSLRVDIPKDVIPVEERRVESGRYLELDTPDMMDMDPVRKVFKEAIAEGSKK